MGDLERNAGGSYALIVQFTGSSRMAFLAPLAFFGVALGLLRFVDVERGEKLAESRSDVPQSERAERAPILHSANDDEDT
jgi:hypothetical protein